ncbi:MAG: sigma-54 dependent transcriptional regulator [Gammaproteobacteria bacterium]|nr:sigma-54 dependent transcriptional regulator [Gammaproteobacteria bacterium]
MNNATFLGQVLVIDDEKSVRQSFCQTLSLDGYNGLDFEHPMDALALCNDQWMGVIVCDLRMPKMDGLAVLEAVKAIDPDIPVILFSAHADIAVAIKAIRSGAYEFLEKTDDPQQQMDTIKRAWQNRQLVLENRALRLSLTEKHEIEHRLLGHSEVMENIRQSVLQLAQLDLDLIINGATGTGKEVVARCLHDFSSRVKRPFVALNCGALAESMIESELFGHEAGAFTGAQKRRIGKLEYANGGTIFLDEVESMPPHLQVRLLRVVQERCLERVGGNELVQLDVRIIAASKVDLRQAADVGDFREDLYYRLNVTNIDLPSIAERKADIGLLFMHFAEISAQKYNLPCPTLDGEQLRHLNTRDWPGNVREINNEAERWALGLSLINSGAKSAPLLDGCLDEQIDQFEKSVIEAALSQNHGHLEHTAAALNIPRKKLYLRMKKHQIDKA